MTFCDAQHIHYYTKEHFESQMVVYLQHMGGMRIISVMKSCEMKGDSLFIWIETRGYDYRRG